MKHAHTREGFTLIEILIAIGIVAVMMAVVAPFALRYRKSARITSVKTTLNALQGAIDQFNQEINQYPNSLQDLIEKPTDPKLAKKWTDRYLKKAEIPEDPWGNEIQYKRTPGGAHPYELYSEGDPDTGVQISVWDI